MIDLGIDFTEAEKASSFLIPDDNYEVQVKSYEHRETQAGRPKLTFLLEVVDPNHADACGKILWHDCVLPWDDPEQGGKRVTSGIGILTGLCEAVGYEWEGSEFDENALVGQRCMASVYQDTYNNKTNNKVKKLFPLG